jgi:hexosaminidase
MSADTVVEIWKDTELVSTFKRWDEYIAPIAKKKYKMVLSACWYLNYISYGQDWKKYYNCDPHNFSG